MTSNDQGPAAQETRVPCDFCGGGPVVATLTAAPITAAGAYELGGELELLAEYDPTWSCCAVCARLIRRDRWPDLTERCLRVTTTATGVRNPLVVEAVHALHGHVRSTMTGPPQPL